MQSPPVSQLVAHAVLTCNCSAATVMLLAVVGGTVECPECKRKFRMKSLNYTVEGNEAMIQCTTEEVGLIYTGGRS